MIFFISAAAGFSQSPRKAMDFLAENLKSLSENHQNTSLYLQTSKGIFEIGEDVWFKAYSLDAHNLEPSVLDSTLYVQLNNKVTDSIVWQEKYEIVNGFSEGHIFLDDSVIEGDYFLKAYTKNSFHSNTKEFYSVHKIKIVANINGENEKIGIGKPLEDSTDDMRFDLFPEGGYLVHGIESKVAFKASDRKGRPLNVSGILFENDVPFLEFNTLHAGMGSFDFLPDKSKKYNIKLRLPKGGRTIDYKIPEIRNAGIVLCLNEKNHQKIEFKISGNTGSQRVYLRTQSRGEVLAMASGVVNDSLNITMPIMDFPQGICEVTLFDKNLRPIAERLVYLNRDKKLHISTELSKEIHRTREKVMLRIKTRDKEGNPVRAHLGASIFDRAYKNSEDAKDILTHYHLSTQLKGTVYNPGYYFDRTNENSKEALDLLMLTQGWRRYIWNENIQKEQKSSTVLTEGIHGSVTTVNKRRNTPEQHMIMLVDPSDSQNNQVVFLDESKQFYLKPHHLELGRRFYIKHFGADDGSKVIVNTNDGFDLLGRESKAHQIGYPVARTVTKEERLVSTYKIVGGVNLDEVTVSAKKVSGFREKYLGQLDSLVKLEINTDYVGGPCGTLNCQVHEFHPENYKPVEGETYEQMLGFKWHNGRTSYTITGYKKKKYKYPSFTEAELLEKFNLLKLTGYYRKKEFYQPDYQEGNDPFPDYRNNLYWKPDIITDKNGNATVEFFTSDINTYFEGIIEGVGSGGLLGKKEFSFFVSKGEGKN